jgi:NAD(P)-dependent dehydrogenase (short-subunit alcohol dehydrogenase family)
MPGDGGREDSGVFTSMDAQLFGKSALITGGTSGIGLAIAHALAKEGVDVAIASRKLDPQVEESLRQGGNRVLGISADVSQEGEVVRMVAATLETFGRLDIFVNNAAIAQHQPLTKIDTETYRKVLDTNLSACLWGCREVARHFVARGGGSILIVGSTSMVYRITKFGLKSLAQSQAVELAPYGIRVNLLVPGHYRTRLTQGIPAAIETQLMGQIPLRRFGDTSDCGNAAVFLLSDALSAYTTGAELVVDGGLALRPLFFGTEEDLQQLNRGD